MQLAGAAQPQRSPQRCEPPRSVGRVGTVTLAPDRSRLRVPPIHPSLSALVYVEWLSVLRQQGSGGVEEKYGGRTPRKETAT
ncbi:Hypothetical protein SMAX5B_014533 [Scophthalmus maximus]|uniref:Uncharacterized protein n=1 Tax=Scophthalmus maximus TaxID=52904 RepID=A0A2U9C437_SCOMX|nr:Hypothetical protein SMAX5B_014533 [Scophthalmus maximus]KAF0036174.1 hypothetical protein F2P81_011486 [Scophthalmus maximus]